MGGTGACGVIVMVFYSFGRRAVSFLLLFLLFYFLFLVRIGELLAGAPGFGIMIYHLWIYKSGRTCIYVIARLRHASGKCGGIDK